ncbi:MAG: Sec-independent protein translocase protein TatB [Candidatus Contendobacter sp.]|nr:Sec-independent protein translocase protein TatB [Candidatus Contendobacter sp.]MDG4557268.1 Sec-independent protein translocase protein TatB [Candidatus Contendobacter sp.]
MFEIGFWELIVVGVVALVVVGPEQLPGLARKAGFWLGKARRMIAEVRAEVDRELHLEEIKQSLRQQANLGEVKDLTDQMQSLRREIEEEFDDPGPPPGWQPGMPTAGPPPPGWTPPVPSQESPVTVDAPTPVQLQKPDAPAPVQTPSPPTESAAVPPPSSPAVN